MTPDTLRIDRRFPKVGRIAKASGTLSAAIKRKIDRMLTDLYQDGRLDILRAIRDGALTCMEVYDAHRRRALHELPIGDTMPNLATAMDVWITSAKTEYSEDHLENLETARKLFAEHDAKARVADLPRVLDELRKGYGAKHKRSFNLARSAAQTFVRATLKRSHPLYIAVAAVEPRKIPKSSRRQPAPIMSIAEMRERFPNPASDKIDASAWAMVVTGMGAKEYWGRWETKSDRVHVAGTKRGGRRRDVPLVMAPAVPQLSRDRWQRVFRERMKKIGATITPYDLRRTYATWLELAQVPRTRRRLYMGHGAKDVTDLYEAYEVTEFLQSDAKKIRAYLGLLDATSTETSTVAIVK